MVGQRTPFDSAQNFEHEKLKSQILLKRESKVIEKRILKGLRLTNLFVSELGVLQ